MSFIRKIKQRGKVYYAEVENIWIDGKCVQKHIRSLGTNLTQPTSFRIEDVHFAFLVTGLMQKKLTPNDIFKMLENMGYRVRKDSLERIGIYYIFEKKLFYIYLFYRRKLGAKTIKYVRSVKIHPKPRRSTKER